MKKIILLVIVLLAALTLGASAQNRPVFDTPPHILEDTTCRVELDVTKEVLELYRERVERLEVVLSLYIKMLEEAEAELTTETIQANYWMRYAWELETKPPYKEKRNKPNATPFNLFRVPKTPN